MSNAQLTDLLAERVMGWKAAPDRFVKPGRSWLPKWRFAPFTSLEDAFLLLDEAAATYTLATTADAAFTAQVSVGGCTGIASGEIKATAITLAIARALGLEAPDEAAKEKNQ